MKKKMWAVKTDNKKLLCFETEEEANSEFMNTEKPRFLLFNPVYILTEDEYKKITKDPFENVRPLLNKYDNKLWADEHPTHEDRARIVNMLLKDLKNFDEGVK